MGNGKVYLIPTIISEDTVNAVIPSQIKAVLPTIKYFLVENVRTARRYLSSLKVYESIEPLRFEVLDKNSSREILGQLFEPVRNGESIGILSESGCPGIADPGSLAVNYAHENNIAVVPLVGPSSIVLALMSSGLNGQRFAFHGYLPIEQRQLVQTLKELEKESRARAQTQIFIETPFRNNNMIRTLLETLSGGTQLTIAADLTGKEEFVRTMKVSQWKKNGVSLPKIPAIFLFLAI